jgi:hypothetical protein
VKVQSLANAYQQTFNPVHIIASNVQRVGPAAPTGSDRTRTLEIYVLAALVIGTLLGAGLAALIDRRGNHLRRT